MLLLGQKVMIDLRDQETSKEGTRRSEEREWKLQCGRGKVLIRKEVLLAIVWSIFTDTANIQY